MRRETKEQIIQLIWAVALIAIIIIFLITG